MKINGLNASSIDSAVKPRVRATSLKENDEEKWESERKAEEAVKEEAKPKKKATEKLFHMLGKDHSPRSLVRFKVHELGLNEDLLPEDEVELHMDFDKINAD